MRKIIAKIFCRMRNAYYLCTVFMIERAPKIRKIGEKTMFNILYNMIMVKTRSSRTIKVSNENKAKLAKMFNCTERMVYKALCFESQTLLARKIQHVARNEMGGWIEAAVREDEIFYDTMDGGERVMRQYFGNGAVLEISLETGIGVVTFNGENVKHFEKVYVDDIPGIQSIALGLSK